MVWYYPYEKKTREEIHRVITKPGGFRAGWMLTADRTTDWQWCSVVGYDGEASERIIFIRDCTEDEKKDLNNLLWSAQICMRYRRVRVGNAWALACID